MLFAKDMILSKIETDLICAALIQIQFCKGDLQLTTDVIPSFEMHEMKH